MRQNQKAREVQMTDEQTQYILNKYKEIMYNNWIIKANWTRGTAHIFELNGLSFSIQNNILWVLEGVEHPWRASVFSSNQAAINYLIAEWI